MLIPTVAMLERLLEASGNELIVTVEPRRERPTIDAVRALREEIVEAVGRFGGTNVRVFGSVARGTASDVSDGLWDTLQFDLPDFADHIATHLDRATD